MISIIAAPRSSTPYPWAKFARWMAAAGLTPDEFQTMLENGAEPSAVLINGAVDQDITYPGLPTLDGSTLEPEPGITILEGAKP